MGGATGRRRPANRPRRQSRRAGVAEIWLFEVWAARERATFALPPPPRARAGRRDHDSGRRPQLRLRLTETRDGSTRPSRRARSSRVSTRRCACRSGRMSRDPVIVYGPAPRLLPRPASFPSAGGGGDGLRRRRRPNPGRAPSPSIARPRQAASNQRRGGLQANPETTDTISILVRSIATTAVTRCA